MNQERKEEPEISHSSETANSPEQPPLSAQLDQFRHGVLTTLSLSNHEQVAQALSEHPDLLSGMAMWSAVRNKFDEVSADYIPLLRALSRGEALAQVHPDMATRLQQEATVRLGDQLRRSADLEVRSEGMQLIADVIDAVPVETQEQWQQRLLGLAHYNLATSLVKAPKGVKLDFTAARTHYEQAIAYSMAAGHEAGALQAREAQAFWVEAKSGDIQRAQNELMYIVVRTSALFNNCQPGDDLTLEELMNTHCNAMLDFIKTQYPRIDIPRQQAASKAMEMFASAASNPILMALVSQAQ